MQEPQALDDFEAQHMAMVYALALLAKRAGGQITVEADLNNWINADEPLLDIYVDIDDDNQFTFEATLRESGQVS